MIFHTYKSTTCKLLYSSSLPCLGPANPVARAHRIYPQSLQVHHYHIMATNSALSTASKPKNIYKHSTLWDRSLKNQIKCTDTILKKFGHEMSINASVMNPLIQASKYHQIATYYQEKDDEDVDIIEATGIELKRRIHPILILMHEKLQQYRGSKSKLTEVMNKLGLIDEIVQPILNAQTDSQWNNAKYMVLKVIAMTLQS